MPRVPRYTSFQPASKIASAIKKRNRSQNTRAEIALRRALWSLGVRFRLHASLPGKPDIVIRRAQTVIFCDGDFWHGRHWTIRRAKLARGSNAKYWIAKIEANIERDRRVTRELRRSGWRVIRVWETDVLADPQRVLDRITRLIASPAPKARVSRSVGRRRTTHNVPRDVIVKAAGRRRP